MVVCIFITGFQHHDKKNKKRTRKIVGHGWRGGEF